MLRAARFIAGYGLVPKMRWSPACRDGGTARDRVGRADPRRAGKLLVVDDPTSGLWFLVDNGIADIILPELPAMRVEQDPIHRHKDVLAHTIAVVAKTRPSLIVRMAALLHDVGKPKTRSIGSHGVLFHHHEVVGARMARDRLRALRFTNEQVDDISQLVYLHLRFHGYSDDVWTDDAVRRYVRDAGHLLDELNELTRWTHHPQQRHARMLARRMDALETRDRRAREQEERPPSVPISTAIR